jgi:hypothetical protein
MSQRTVERIAVAFYVALVIAGIALLALLIVFIAWLVWWPWYTGLPWPD